MPRDDGGTNYQLAITTITIYVRQLTTSDGALHPRRNYVTQGYACVFAEFTGCDREQMTIVHIPGQHSVEHEWTCVPSWQSWIREATVEPF